MSTHGVRILFSVTAENPTCGRILFQSRKVVRKKQSGNHRGNGPAWMAFFMPPFGTDRDDEMPFHAKSHSLVFCFWKPWPLHSVTRCASEIVRIWKGTKTLIWVGVAEPEKLPLVNCPAAHKKT